MVLDYGVELAPIILANLVNLVVVDFDVVFFAILGLVGHGISTKIVLKAVVVD